MPMRKNKGHRTGASPWQGALPIEAARLAAVARIGYDIAMIDDAMTPYAGHDHLTEFT
jgi:hypothetical protein